MKSDEELHLRHIQWALAFSKMDTSEREQHLEEIKTRLYEFIRDANLQAPGRHFGVALPEPKIYVGRLTNEDVMRIFQAFKEGFVALANQAIIVTSPILGAPVSFYLGALSPLARFFQSIVIHTDPVSQVAVALELHFVRSGLTGGKIRKCPECGTIFISERKGQKYCSTACARAVANREYYQRQQETYVKAEVKLKKSSPAVQPSTPAPAAPPAKKKPIKKR